MGPWLQTAFLVFLSLLEVTFTYPGFSQLRATGDGGDQESIIPAPALLPRFHLSVPDLMVSGASGTVHAIQVVDPALATVPQRVQLASTPSPPRTTSKGLGRLPPSLVGSGQISL